MGQLVDNREYSDMNSANFFCGSSKTKKEISAQPEIDLAFMNYTDEAR